MRARAPAADRADLHSALTGDKDAFARLVERRERSLYGLALVILGRPEDAADALQNAVVLAYRKLRGLRQPASFDAWLRQIVAREAMGVARRRGEAPVVASSLPSADAIGQCHPASGASEAAMDETVAGRIDLAAALGELDDAQRTALVLRYAADLTVREIAKLTGVPGGTVKSRIHYGLKRMRQLLAPDRDLRKGGGQQ